MKKRIDLATAKNILKSEKIFLNNGGGFNYACFGKYKPGLTFILPDEWNIDSDGEVESPICWKECPEITKNMNIDFDGEESVLFGSFWTSKSGSPCFKVTDPKNAKYLLIRVDWGGAFNSTRGASRSYVAEVSPTWYRCAASNGGETGYDYWVLPVGFVAFSELRDVSSILEEYSKSEAERVKKNEEDYLKKVAIEKESAEAKSRFIERLELAEKFLAAVDEEEGYYHDNMIFGDAYFKFRYSSLPYTEENVKKVEERVEEVKKQRELMELYAPKAHAYDTIAAMLGYTIKLTRYGIELKSGKTFDYSEEGIGELAEYFFDEQRARQKAEEERIRKLAEAEAMAKKMAMEAEAAAAGYPSNFSFWKREGGRTGLSKAYVIQADGTTREPDVFEHRPYKSDGTEIWKQILGSELVITYTKSCTAAPYVCEVFFKPECVTEAQKEFVEELRVELTKRFEDATGLVSKSRSPECEGWNL